MEFKHRVWDLRRKRMYGHDDVAYITQHRIAMIAYQDERGSFESMLMPPDYVEMLAPGPVDTHGTLIHEGDLLTYPDHEGVYEVKYDKEDCEYVAERKDPYRSHLLPAFWPECEIVGNIYEDPKSVKGGKR